MNKLFLLGCIPIRLLLVYISRKIPGNVLFLPLMLIGLGFLFLYLTNGRMNAPESQSGTTWWAKLRIIHAGLYLTASYLAFHGSDKVWIPLLIDLIFGLVAFLVHYN